MSTFLKRHDVAVRLGFALVLALVGWAAFAASAPSVEPKPALELAVEACAIDSELETTLFQPSWLLPEGQASASVPAIDTIGECSFSWPCRGCLNGGVRVPGGCVCC